MKKIILLILVLVFAIGTFSACSDGEYKVQYYVGSKLVYTEKTVNGKVSYKYPKPEKGIFKGWYLDPEYTKPFNGKVTKNMKLYGYIYVAAVPNPI
ncbi:MAG: hypothetical protein J1F36_07120 [Clostridiales bacterium]|nr:hypothetical protein [Clostridiales bacterium]